MLRIILVVLTGVLTILYVGFYFYLMMWPLDPFKITLGNYLLGSTVLWGGLFLPCLSIGGFNTDGWTTSKRSLAPLTRRKR